jgi:uncharacterized membrane protein
MEWLYRLILNHKALDLFFLTVFVILSLDVRLRYYFYLLSTNTFPQSDDSTWYLNYANDLMHNWKIGLHMDDILYFGYNFLLTVLLAIFKSPEKILFIQAVTAAVSVILVYRIAQMLFNRTTAVIAAFFYCNYAWGITLWAMYILADSFFVSLLLLNVYFLLSFMETKRNVFKVLFIVTAVYMLIFKPTGIMSLAFILLYIVLNLKWGTIAGFFRRYRWLIGGGLAAAVAAFLALYLGHKLDPLIESMAFNVKKVLYNIYARGRIYDIPSPYDHFFRPDYRINILDSLALSFIINNWDHVIIIYGQRFVAFLGRWVWQTNLSAPIGYVKLIYRLIPTFLFLFGTFYPLITKQFKRASIAPLTVLAVFIFCIIFFIDGMYRYKAPAIPFIAITAAYGAERMIVLGIRIANKYAGKLLWKKKKYSL